MNKFVLAGLLAASIGLPAIAIAQTLPAVPAGSVVCRPVKAGEKPNAMMGTAGLHCKMVNVAKVMAAEKTLMSMMKTKMTATEMKHMNDANAIMSEELMLPQIPGTNGNPNN
jgi:hypothetical protein